ncbi:hypothetical protein NMY22_g8210 [Coprinellus aureogranulatus]|nr:hypothetical protein NMY22_g8210 [Coprinellus aureogranulatus]
MASDANKARMSLRGHEDIEMEEEVVNVADTFSPDNTQAPPPEREWAKTVNTDLFKSGLKGRRKDNATGIPKATLPLSKTTPGSRGIFSSLETHARASEAIFADIPPVQTEPGPSDPHAESYWDLHSHDGLRVSFSFLENHVRDLVWMRDCHSEHHRGLLRNRNHMQSVLDAISRALYVNSRQEELEELLDKMGDKGKSPA